MFQSYLIHYCVPGLSQTLFVYIRRGWLCQVVVLVVCVRDIIRFLLYFRSPFKAQSREETLICTLDNHSVPSNILSPSMVQAVLVSFVTCSGSCLLSVSDIADQLARFPSFLNKLRFLRKEAFFPTVYKCVILGFCAALTRPSIHALKTWIGSILNFWIELS